MVTINVLGYKDKISREQLLQPLYSGQFSFPFDQTSTDNILVQGYGYLKNTVGMFQEAVDA